MAEGPEWIEGAGVAGRHNAGECGNHDQNGESSQADGGIGRRACIAMQA
ncbi:MAG: hypothetical protein JO260_03160 [Acidobacteria bacterium]|nr:hypothetical protein [Acidobacteriota bacterium]